MAKPQPAPDPSVEEMLSTIRRAIDEETAKSVQDPARQAAVSGSMREMRVSLQPPGSAPAKPAPGGPAPVRPEPALSAPPPPPVATTRVTAGPGKPFAGIMGGDVRLEEALARLQRAERRQEKNQPPVAPMAPRVEAPQRTPAPLPPRPQRTYHTSPPLAGSEGPTYSSRPNMAAQGSPVNRRQATVKAPPAPPLAAAQPSPTAETVPQPAPIQSALDPLRSADAGRKQPPPPVREPGTPCTPAATAVQLPGLLSNSAEQAATDAFARLSEEVLMRSLGGGDRLADTTRDMLRPMLKSWLDQNLPELVERLVREEIERVVRRGGH